MLRIRPGKEKVGQIQPQRWGLCWGQELARPQGCAGPGSWLWELETSPAAGTTGQALTDLAQGSKWGPEPTLAMEGETQGVPWTASVGSALKVCTASYLNTKS